MDKFVVTPAKGETIDASLVVDAIRVWSSARDLREPLQPSLFAALAARGGGVLAPVFDSLMTLCETALGRRLRPGRDDGRSADERLLLELLVGAVPARARLGCAEGIATAFDAALRSTRIMLKLAGAGTAHPPRYAAA